MGQQPTNMGACGCGGEEDKGRATKDTKVAKKETVVKTETVAKKGWFKGTSADVAKAKESGADVASGADAESATLVTEVKEVKKDEAVWFRGCPKKLEEAGIAAPKEADATETAALDKAVPLAEEVAAPADEEPAAEEAAAP